MKRVLTALLLAPPIVYLVLAGHPLLLLVVTAAVAVLTYYEFTSIAAAHGLNSAGPLGYAAGLLLLALPGIHAGAIAGFAILALVKALGTAELARVLPQAAGFTLGVAYVFGPWRCGLALHAINPHWLMYALAITWLGDMAAYVVGSMAGRHKMAPRISPAKSWEGAAASMAMSLLFGVLYLQRVISSVPLLEVIGLTVVASAAGQLGDLCESAIKRGAGVKDSGSLLPGHGGWLDRVDASLFTMPVVYFWVSRGV
jgi:phosphatidate cytidylyltransferase